MQIEQNNVWAQILRQKQPFVTVGSRAYDLEIGLPAQSHLQAVQSYLMILDYENADVVCHVCLPNAGPEHTL